MLSPAMHPPFGSQVEDWVFIGLLAPLIPLVVYLVVYLHRLASLQRGREERMVELLEKIEQHLAGRR